MGTIYLISEGLTCAARHHVMALSRLVICGTPVMMRFLYKKLYLLSQKRRIKNQRDF
jgi:NAD(P)H-flavin reductase